MIGWWASQARDAAVHTAHDEITVAGLVLGDHQVDAADDIRELAAVRCRIGWRADSALPSLRW